MVAHQLSAAYNDLQRAFNANDLKTCGTLLAQLKIALIETGLLLPRGDEPLEDLVVARDILELGAFHALRTRDVPAFDRFFAQLLAFYTDLAPRLPPSPREHPLRGLQLTRLLTQNRIADFHTALESLPRATNGGAGAGAGAGGGGAGNAYIDHPVNLERWLMEGSYSKVWNAREEAPSEEYKFFVDSLMGTIRNEIASCEEAAYESLPLKDAATLLFFQSQSELLTFAQQRGWQVDLSAGSIVFSRKGEEQAEIPKEKMIAATLAYARELEQIV